MRDDEREAGDRIGPSPAFEALSEDWRALVSRADALRERWISAIEGEAFDQAERLEERMEKVARDLDALTPRLRALAVARGISPRAATRWGEKRVGGVAPELVGYRVTGRRR